MDSKTLGNRLKYARVSLRELTLQDVADATGVARSTVQRYEAGKIENIKLPVIESFARALGVNPSWLVGKSEDMFLLVGNEYPPEDTDSSLELDEHERAVILAYRNQPDMQAAVDRILGVEQKTYNLAQAAHNQQPLILNEEQAKEFAKLADEAPDSSSNKDMF